MRTAITGLLALAAVVAAISVITTPTIHAQTVDSNSEFYEQSLPEAANMDAAPPETADETVAAESTGETIAAESTGETIDAESTGETIDAESTGETIDAGSPEQPAPEEQVELGTFMTTSYSLQGVMKGGDWTYYGAVAVDPRVIPLGSTIYIEDLGYFVAEDTGGAVKGDHIDIWLPSRGEALSYGVQYRRTWLVG